MDQKIIYSPVARTLVWVIIVALAAYLVGYGYHRVDGQLTVLIGVGIALLVMFYAAWEVFRRACQV